MMQWRRALRHLTKTDRQVRRCFPADTVARIQRAVQAAERGHRGELCVVVEGALPLLDALRGKSAHDRALEVFSLRRIWDTEHNSGVLIYLLLADRQVEIIADRGIHRWAGDRAWAEICQQMQDCFRTQRFEDGIVLGLQHSAELLRRHFPAVDQDRNELPDAPVIG